MMTSWAVYVDDGMKQCLWYRMLLTAHDKEGFGQYADEIAALNELAAPVIIVVLLRGTI